MRTYTYQVDRVDQELAGNRGYVMGKPETLSEEPEREKTRTMYNIEVELPSSYKTKAEGSYAPRRPDKELYGNRGYIKGGISPEKEIYAPVEEPMGKKGGVTRFGGFPQQAMPQVIYSEPVSRKGTEESGGLDFYVVQKGDTLQKVSDKFFGTTKKWKKIYNANKNILKSPDMIRPGQKLAIPKD